MIIQKKLTLVDEILTEYEKKLGSEYQAYRNHVYRIVNLCFSLGDFDVTDKKKIQIAACFHDVGIWTAGTIDYLAPSEEEATRYLVKIGKSDWVSEVVEMIEMHHRLRSCSSSNFPLVEAFRRADIADFSLGIFSMGVSKDVVDLVKTEFPNAGFHKFLLKLGIKRLLSHPFNPLPMFRV